MSMFGRGFGYSFKQAGKDRYGHKITVLQHHLVRLTGSDSLVEKPNMEKIFLRPEDGVGAIFGIGNPAEPKSIGLVWAHNDRQLVEALYEANIEDFYPYKFQGQVGKFYAQDGEVYVIDRAAPIACECGATKCRSNIHSTWCPVYKK